MDLTELKRQNTAGFKRHPWEITRAGIIYFLLKPYFAGIKNIADIGSGDVYVLQQLRSRGVEGRFAAVDTSYSPELIARLNEILSIKNVQLHRSKEELEIKSEGIDLFLFLDVLEHCEDDKDVLRSYIQSPVGGKSAYFLVTVPAYQSLWSKHDLLLGHFRRYNRSQLVNICKQENLKILQSGYFFTTLLPVRSWQLILEKAGLRKPARSIDNWKGSSFLSKLISAILWLDFRIGYSLSKAGIHLPGLSCYCLCQKLPS